MIINLFLAPSLNGFIAHSDGTEEFISEKTWNFHARLIEDHGSLIVSRKSVDVVDSWNDPKYSLDKLSAHCRIIVTRDESYTRPGWEVAHSPGEVTKILELHRQEMALLIGGANLASSFLNEKLINKAYFLYQPWLVNEGIQMGIGLKLDIKLNITSSTLLDSNELLVEADILN